MTTLHVNGQRRTMPRRQITRLTADLATVHLEAVEGDGWRSPADTWVQHRGQPIYRVTDCRVLVYCEDMMTHRNPNDRQPWQPVTAPTWLTSHANVVAWVIAALCRTASAKEGLAA